jgi:hypothetical protein
MLALYKDLGETIIGITEVGASFFTSTHLSNTKVFIYKLEKVIALVWGPGSECFGVIYYPEGFMFNDQLQTANSFDELVDLLNSLLQ